MGPVPDSSRWSVPSGSVREVGLRPDPRRPRTHRRSGTDRRSFVRRVDPGSRRGVCPTRAGAARSSRGHPRPSDDTARRALAGRSRAPQRQPGRRLARSLNETGILDAPSHARILLQARGSRTTSSGDTWAMVRITDVRPVLLTHPYGTEPGGRRSACFVEVETDAGITGVGETYAGVYVPEVAAAIIELFRPLVVGQDATAPE